jgi:hypothetical protein
MEGEVMAPMMVSNSLHLSTLTLALLEDSGWYTPDYSLATKPVQGVLASVYVSVCLCLCVCCLALDVRVTLLCGPCQLVLFVTRFSSAARAVVVVSVC